MSFALSEEQQLIQRTVRELAATRFADRAKQADLDQAFPRENVKALAEMGLLGITLDPEVGGAGADTVAYALACEEIAAACATTGAFTALTNAWITGPIAHHGSDEVKSEWLPRILGGDKLGTYGLFEDAVGGDPTKVRSTARPLSADGHDDATGMRDGAADAAPRDPTTEVGPARLSGTKDLTFLVGLADLALVVARRGGGEASGGRRVDLYAVPTDREGVAWGRDESKLGLRGLPAGPLYLSRVPLEASDLIGGPGQGVQIAREAYRFYSIGISACAVGLTRAALEAAVRFANERVQFGHPIAEYQAIQHYVAEIRTGADAARNIVLNAAAHHDRARKGNGGDLNLVEEANVLAFETGRRMTRLAIRIHGGAGFMRDLPVERYARDVRTLEALGRMPDVSKTLIGTSVLGMGTQS